MLYGLLHLSIVAVGYLLIAVSHVTCEFKGVYQPYNLNEVNTPSIAVQPETNIKPPSLSNKGYTNQVSGIQPHLSHTSSEHGTTDADTIAVETTDPSNLFPSQASSVDTSIAPDQNLLKKRLSKAPRTPYETQGQVNQQDDTESYNLQDILNTLGVDLDTLQKMYLDEVETSYLMDILTLALDPYNEGITSEQMQNGLLRINELTYNLLSDLYQPQNSETSYASDASDNLLNSLNTILEIDVTSTAFTENSKLQEQYYAAVDNFLYGLNNFATSNIPVEESTDEPTNNISPEDAEKVNEAWMNYKTVVDGLMNKYKL